MNTERNLAEGVCDSIRCTTPDFAWKPRSIGRLGWWIAGLYLVLAVVAIAVICAVKGA